MKVRLAVLFVGSAFAALAQTAAGYVWDYSGYGAFAGYGGGVLNGDTTLASASGAFAIWPTTVSGANPQRL